ncbi:MAG: response regulator [Pseudomonadota bacterium]
MTVKYLLAINRHIMGLIAMLKSVMTNAHTDPMLPAPGQDTQQILIVDDDAMVGAMTGHCIKRAGFGTHVFDNPADALTWFAHHHRHINLVISDHNMPGLTGTKMAEQMASIAPTIPVIICSGYIAAIEEDVADIPNINRVMAKPTPTPDLVQAVKEALSAVDRT